LERVERREKEKKPAVTKKVQNQTYPAVRQREKGGKGNIHSLVENAKNKT